MSVRVWRAGLPARRARLAEALDAPTLYLCATRPLLDAVRAEFFTRPGGVPTGRAGGGYPGRGAAEVDFLLLPWMARNLLEAAGEPAVTLGPAGRYAVVERAVRELHAAGGLEAFAPVAATPGFARSVAGLIGELKRAGASPDAFEAAVERLDAGGARPGSADSGSAAPAGAAGRYRELAALYRRIQAVLAELGVLEPDDVEAAALARAAADGGAWFGRYRRLVVDGFTGLAPVQRRLLALALRAIPEADILWPADPPRPSPAGTPTAVPGPWARGIASRRLAALLEEAGVPVEGEGAEALGSESLGPPQSGIALAAWVAAPEVERLEAPTPEDELRWVAGRCKAWLLGGAGDRAFSERFHPAEIAVVAVEPDEVARALAREGVPVRDERGDPLGDIPAVRAVMRLWEAAASDDAAAFLAVLASSYFRWPRAADPDAVDRAYRALGRPAEASLFLRRLRARCEAVERALDRIRTQLEAAGEPAGGAAGDEWTAAGPRAADDGDGGMRALLARDRARLLREARELREVLTAGEDAARRLGALPRAGPPGALVDAVRRLAADLGLAGRARDPAAGPAAMGRDLRGLEAFWAAAADVARAWGAGPVDLQEVASSLGRALEGLRAPPPPRRSDGVRVLAPAQAAGLRVAAVAVVGCVEGQYPRAFTPDWLVPEAERQRFREAGLELDLLEERHEAAARGFWDAVAAAGRRLLVSHARATADGTPLLPSRFLARLAELGPVTQTPEPEAPWSPAGLVRTATRLPHLVAGVAGALHGLQAGRAGRGRDPGLAALAAALARRLEARGALGAELRACLVADREREGRRFSAWDGALGSGPIRTALAARFTPERPLGPTALNDYGHCGFLFFAGRVLGLEPREPAPDTLTALERGSLAHEALRQFVSESRDGPWPPPLEESRRRLSALVRELGAAYLAEAPHLHPALVALDLEHLEAALHRWLDGEHRAAASRAVDVRPVLVEASFGMPVGQRADPRSRPEPLVLEDEHGTRLAVRGRVDRVDAAADGRYLVYDYKWSKGGRRVDDLVAGFEFQIPLYLLAVRDLLLPEGNPVGAAYYGLSDGHRAVGLWREGAEACAGDLRGHMQPLDDAAWQDRLAEATARALEFARSIRAGAFELNPRRCLRPHCNFWGACRYERRRVGGKVGAHVR